MRIFCSHIIMATRGFWLPNDPRGSWSEFVGAWELWRYGRATKVRTRRSVAHVSHNQIKRFEAKRAMKYPTVRFTGVQARAVGRGFSMAIDEGGYAVYACSIMPDHVHLVVEPHDRSFERMVGHLKSKATRQLSMENIHPLDGFVKADGSIPSPWAEGMWKVFCFDANHARCAIEYVRRNPLKEGKPAQRWSFVREWEGDDLRE